MHHLYRLADYRRAHERVVFDRSELAKLLAVYADRVACGEWRDYAIDHLGHMAAFSVFRSSYDRPLYVVAKLAEGGQRQASYVLSSGPEKLVQGRTLDDVLAPLARRLRLVETV